MSRRRTRKSRAKAGVKSIRRRHEDPTTKIETPDLAARERYFEIFATTALFAFGVYNSVLYFGHTIVPNSDFVAFFQTGQELLSLQTPSSFKRVPVLGLCQVLLSYVVGGRHAGLTAGWLLNAILHPFNLLLLWLVGREIVGKSALWLAIIVIINPWVIYLLTEPIAETTLLFFVLLTFYLIFKRSRWRYLFASITTMVRYEGAALILAAFVMDMIYRKSRRERILAILHSAAAALPLAIWMLWTALNWEGGASHYLTVLFDKEYAAKGFAESVESRTGLALHMRLLWQVAFRPLFTPSPETGEMLWRLSKVLATIGFCFGSIYGLCRRQWKILALLLFFVPYFLLHARYPYPLRRFHASILWIALLVTWFGVQSVWRIIDKDGRVPRGLTIALQVLVVIIAFAWLIRLVPALPGTSRRSPTSASLPYVAMTLVAIIFAGRIYIYKFGYFLRELSIFALTLLIIASNQFSLVDLVSDGQKNKEFKLLADWYVASAKPGEKLAVYMVPVVRIFAPEYAECIVRPPGAGNPSEFVKACYENDITYVVWATREGLRGGHTGYRKLGLHKNIDLLKEPRSIGPYRFIERVGSERGWVHIFRLLRPAGMNQKPP